MNRAERKRKKAEKELANSKVPRGIERLKFDITHAVKYIQTDKLRSSNEHSNSN